MHGICLNKPNMYSIQLIENLIHKSFKMQKPSYLWILACNYGEMSKPSL